ncbi:MAG TPA: hypothetical protein VG538_06185 [Vicinamibacterales bacterium]|jgi:uncharacterized phage infection (PIP) family protein YhgE|nr:hypothetical protein [Vicinamibacterales bacterium]
MAAPQLDVFVTANLTEIRKRLANDLGPIIATTQTTLTRMSHAFDGAAIISQAGAAVKAIGDIGGASKLTAGEQQKLNGILDEAIQKYKALGTQAPPEMVALEQATRSQESAWSRANDALGKFGLSLQGLTVAGVIGSIVAIGKDAIESAGHLADMSAATGLSTTELQRLGQAGAQVGVDVDTVARSVQGLQRNLTNGSDGAVEAVRQLGLNVGSLLAMSPGAMFETIARAIAQIPDPAERTNTAIELLGKQGAAALPLLVSNIDELESHTHAMRDSTVAKLDELGDKWSEWKETIKTAIGETIANFSTLQGAMEHWIPVMQAWSQQHDMAQQAIDATVGLQTETDTFKQHADGLADTQNRINGYLQTFASTRAKDAQEATQQAAQAARDHQAAVKAEADEIIRLNAQLVDEVTKMDAMVTHSFVTTQAIQSFASSMKQMGQALTLPQYGDSISVAEHGLSTLMAKNAAPDALFQSIKFMPRLVLPKAPELASFGAELGQALSSAIQGGGNVAEAGGAFVGGALGNSIAKSAASTLTSTLGKTFGGVIDAVLPGLGTLLGSLAGKAISGLGKLFGFGTAGRDLVQQFADSMGGFDALHDKLDQIGDAGEQLWKTLTQGVGSNNPKQAQAAIDSVNAALDQFNQTQQDLQDHFASLLDAVGDFGGKAPKALQPMIEQLLQMQGLTEEQQQLLKDMLGDPSMDALQDAADTLGVSFEHMGQQFKEAQIDKTAFSYQHALDTLRDSGADMNGVLLDSKDKINDLVDQAITAGAALPDTLKPYIQKLIDMGQLVAPDGSLVTNIDQLSFADIPDDSLDAIKTILQQIRDILQHDIPQAASYAQSALDAVHMPADISPGPNYVRIGGQWVNAGSPEAAQAMKDSQNRNANAANMPHMAAGGLVTRPTVALIGEAGPEMVVPLSRGGGFVGAGANISIVVNPSRGMNERELAQEVARRLPQALRQAGY